MAQLCLGQHTHFAGYVVVTLDSVIEAHPLPAETSTQKAELVNLTRALQLTAGVQVNIYTDSKYAFTTTHVHGALYKERDSLTWEEKVSSMDRKSSNCQMLCGSLNGWQLH
jgi:ribonuclease HI